MDNLHKMKCVPCEGDISKLTTGISKEFRKQTPNWKIIKNHHPDIALSWGKLIITLYTHAINGLHPNDFILASKIDKLK